MSSTALQQLADLHRLMYEQAFAEARATFGDDNLAINHYADEFAKSLPESFKIVQARRISQAIDSHNIVLFGDFHSHKQCQRALLRIMRTYNNTPDHAPMALALEMFRSQDQPALNAWQEGRISDDTLLEITDYHKIWGFPWMNYKPLLEYCRNQSIPLHAVNTNNAGRDNLRARDEHAAKIMSTIHQGHKSRKIFYIVGEYHLADSQLPASIAEHQGISVLRIIANSEKYFFKLPQHRVHRRDEFLELTQSFFCVLNSPPWIKWQSQTLNDELKRIGASTYIAAEIGESTTDEYNDYDDDDLYNEDVVDLDSHLKGTVDHVAAFLQLKKTSRFHDSFKIAPSVDDENTGHLPENARATIFEQTSREGVASDFGRRILFLPELSINNLAFSAGLVIFGSLSNLKEDYSKAEDLFVAETLKFIFGHLANKILNPRISLHSRKAIEDYLGAIRGKHVVGQRRLRRDVARATLKFFNWAADAATSGQENIAKDRNVPLDILHTDTRSAHDVARHIAQTTTSAIYSKMLAGRLDTTDIAKWFSRKCDTSSKAKLLLKDLIRFA